VPAWGLLGVGLGRVEDERGAGGERSDLGEGERRVADVLDRSEVEAAADDLVDEPSLVFDDLPRAGVEAPSTT
jgi:hypothetical protein